MAWITYLRTLCLPQHMKALVLAEDSATTDEEADVAIDYYRGTFRPVAQLTDELSRYANVELHIITENNSLITGETLIRNAPEKSKEQAIKDTVSLLTEYAPKMDIIVILLSTDLYRQIIVENWEGIIEGTKENTIWCLGTSRSALASCDLNLLKEHGQKLFTYERVGVAPIDIDTRKSLLSYVEKHTKN